MILSSLELIFVAVGGLEPPTVSLPQELQTWLLYQLSYTAYHIYFSGSRLMQVPNPT